MQAQRRRNEVRNHAVPRMDQNQELADPPGYIGLRFVTMALLCLVVFLVWLVAILLLQRGEQDKRTFRLLEERLQEGRDLGN